MDGRKGEDTRRIERPADGRRPVAGGASYCGANTSNDGRIIGNAWRSWG